MEIENSEELRQQLKQDILEANDKFVQLEEELFESKTIQLELLENLKKAEDELEKYIMENEGKFDDLQKEFEGKLVWSRDKINEQIELMSQLEHNQCIYIAHRPDPIDLTLGNFINKYPERRKMGIMFLRESEGVYQFGSKRVYVKVEKGERILVRVGGGYMSIDKFIEKYTPEEQLKIQRKDVAKNFADKIHG